jgi:hypothetical protein
MVQKKAEKPVESADPVEASAGSEAEASAAQEQVNRWEFINRTPSPAEVSELLATLPEWWGVVPREFADYVQALPSNKKIKVPVKLDSGNTRTEERRFDVVTLYFSVAGRMQMLRDAQERYGWRVDFVPEPVTKTGVPGFLQMDERLVYREYVEVWEPVGINAPRLYRPADVDAPSVPRPVDAPVFTTDVPGAKLEPIGARRWFAGQEFALLGRKPGMAWVPESGGLQAKGSNPYEKVETAARGRALAAWGFGVLPGSGVASYEEMMGVPQNREAAAGLAAERAGNGAARREKPEELHAQILTLAEEARQLLGEAEGWNLGMVRDYVKRTANVDVATVIDPDGSVLELDMTRVPPAALLLIRNGLRDRVAKLRDAKDHGA